MFGLTSQSMPHAAASAVPVETGNTAYWGSSGQLAAGTNNGAGHIVGVSGQLDGVQLDNVKTAKLAGNKGGTLNEATTGNGSVVRFAGKAQSNGGGNGGGGFFFQRQPSPDLHAEKSAGQEEAGNIHIPSSEADYKAIFGQIGLMTGSIFDIILQPVNSRLMGWVDTSSALARPELSIMGGNAFQLANIKKPVGPTIENAFQAAAFASNTKQQAVTTDFQQKLAQEHLLHESIYLKALLT